MTTNERNDDIISEQTFSIELVRNGAADSPQTDSPADSETDADTEFLIGLCFRPYSEDAFEESEDDEIEDFEKSDKTIYAEQKSASASETPSLESDLRSDIKMANSNATVVDSKRPSPQDDV